VHGLADPVAVPPAARRAERGLHVRHLRGSVLGIDGPAPPGVAPASGSGNGDAVGSDRGARAGVAGGVRLSVTAPTGVRDVRVVRAGPGESRDRAHVVPAAVHIVRCSSRRDPDPRRATDQADGHGSGRAPAAAATRSICCRSSASRCCSDSRGPRIRLPMCRRSVRCRSRRADDRPGLHPGRARPSKTSSAR
jgi:hypothetical protein